MLGSTTGTQVHLLYFQLGMDHSMNFHKLPDRLDRTILLALLPGLQNHFWGCKQQ